MSMSPSAALGLRKQGQQGAANLAAMSPEEQQQYIFQQFGSVLGQLGATQGATDNPYLTALQEFQQARVGISAGPQAMIGAAIQRVGEKVGPYRTSPTGKVMYDNGAIFDPVAGSVLWDETDPMMDGSSAWLSRIQDDWSAAKANAWRKRLVKQGYDQAVPGGLAKSGGIAMDLITALRAYHENRYLNYGKPIPVSPSAAEGREAIRKQIDFMTLKEEVKGWGEVPFEEALDDDTAEYFAEQVVRTLTKLHKKHPTWSFSQLEAGAQTRVQKEFIERPAVKRELREIEEDEMDETLRQSIVGIAQLGAV